MRENDIFGVKPFNELLEIIKEEMKKIYEKNIPEEDKDLYNLSEKEIEEEWKKLLKEYKVEEICSIRQDKKMVKEYFIIVLNTKLLF